MSLARGVILNARGNPKAQGLQIFVPPSVADHVVIAYCCRVPGCGATFRKGEKEAWQRHVGPCARANIDRLRAVMDRAGAGPLGEDFDPEVTKHMRKLGETMIREGRLTVKPSERAGFS